MIGGVVKAHDRSTMLVIWKPKLQKKNDARDRHVESLFSGTHIIAYSSFVIFVRETYKGRRFRNIHVGRSHVDSFALSLKTISPSVYEDCSELLSSNIIFDYYIDMYIHGKRHIIKGRICIHSRKKIILIL